MKIHIDKVDINSISIHYLTYVIIFYLFKDIDLIGISWFFWLDQMYFVILLIKPEHISLSDVRYSLIWATYKFKLFCSSFKFIYTKELFFKYTNTKVGEDN